MMEIKEVLSIFDIELPEGTEATAEEITKQKDAKWIGRAVAESDDEIIKKVTGKRLGSLETETKRAFKEIGVEFSPEEIKDKKIEDVIKLATTKIGEQITTLKAKGSEGADKKLQDAQKELEVWQKKHKETDELYTNTKSLLETKETEYANTMKNFKLNHLLAEAKSKIPFADSADEYQRKGFDATFNENYKVDLDEKDQLVIRDKDGNQIKNSNGSVFLGFSEVYKQDLEKAKLLKVNSGGGAGGGPKYQPQNNGGGNNGGGGNGGGSEITAHPNASNLKYV